VADANIVWIRTEAGWDLARLTKAIGNSPVLGLFESGDQQWIRAQNIMFRSSEPWDPARNHNQLRDHRQRVLAFLSEAKRQLGELWSTVQSDPETATSKFSLPDLASFLSGSDEPAFQDAVFRAIHEDKIYFKQRDNRWTIRSEQTVRQNIQQIEASQRRDQKERPWIDALHMARSGAALSVPEELHFQEACQLLESFLLLPMDHPKHIRGKNLLAKLDGLGSSADQDLALRVLVESGFYEQDENLDLRKHQIPLEFEPRLVEAATQLASQISGDHNNQRSDLTVYAIDSANTRDVDDAVGVRRVTNGYEIHVMITDLAEALPLDHPLSIEAAKRGSTIYLPDRKIPMLPKLLSERELSLGNKSPRAVINFCILLNDEGTPYDARIEALQTSRVHRLTYDEADQILAQPARVNAPSTTEDLSTMWMLAQRCRAQRRARGAFFWQPPEFDVSVGSSGDVEVHHVNHDSAARIMVSELMILCGHMTARYCSERSIPVVYRAQPPPNDKLALPQEPKLKTNQIFDLIRKMRPAKASKEPGVHAGLGLSAYCRVTSPIRRFSDFLLHVQIKNHLRTGNAQLQQGDLHQRIEKNDKLVRRNNQIMRNAKNYWILKYYGQGGSRPVSARILEVSGNQVKVLLEDTGFISSLHMQRPPTAGETLELKVIRAFPRENKLVLRV
jgi:exoribonuclease-2